MKHFFLLLALLMFVSVNTIASTWDPPAGSNLDWCNSANWWFDYGPPISTDTAIINSTPEGPVRIGVGCYAEAAQLIIA